MVKSNTIIKLSLFLTPPSNHSDPQGDGHDAWPDLLGMAAGHALHDGSSQHHPGSHAAAPRGLHLQ